MTSRFNTVDTHMTALEVSARALRHLLAHLVDFRPQRHESREVRFRTQLRVGDDHPELVGVVFP